MAVTITSNTGSVYAEYDNVKETFPVSTASSTALEGEVLTVDTIVAGTGYTTITSAPISGGTGTGLVVNITAVAGGVTAVTVVDGGIGYAVSDTITLTGGGADATFDIATVTDNKVAVAGRVVVGSYSQFLSEAVKGDWIWLKDTDELRRIESVSDDGKIILETNATTDSSTDYAIIKRQGFNKVRVMADNAAVAKINKVEMPISFEDEFRTDLRFIPILIDTTANANAVTVSAQNW